MKYVFHIYISENTVNLCFNFKIDKVILQLAFVTQL